MATVSALVFSGRNGLEFFDLRLSVVRIPEVMGRIREAQGILDNLDLPKSDLLNTICSLDESFFRNPRLKNLAIAVVQVGLYDRYLKTQRKPDYFIGSLTSDSAARVTSGQISFKDLILQSPALESMKNTERVLSLVTGLPTVDGEREEFGLIGLMPEQAERMPALRLIDTETQTALKQLVLSLNEDLGVTRFIHIGPAGGLKSFDYNQLGNDEIEALDSIELDPMLGWFWRGHRGMLNESRSLAN